MFPKKGPNPYGQPPQYGAQQPYGKIVWPLENSSDALIGKPYLMVQGSDIFVQTLAPCWLGFGSLVAVAMRHLLQQLVALMAVSLAAMRHRVLWGSMEGLMLRFMARRRLICAPFQFEF